MHVIILTSEKYHVFYNIWIQKRVHVYVKETHTIFRLRSGYNRMRHHLFHKYRICDTHQCSSNTGPRPLREALRKDIIWPNGVYLQKQLYGDRVDMQWTAEYIRRAGLTV
jgi:hypothetical protein